MRTVYMALVVLWWCHLAVILPVILGQQAKDNWDRVEEQDSTKKYGGVFTSQTLSESPGVSSLRPLPGQPSSDGLLGNDVRHSPNSKWRPITTDNVGAESQSVLYKETSGQGQGHLSKREGPGGTAAVVNGSADNDGKSTEPDENSVNQINSKEETLTLMQSESDTRELESDYHPETPLDIDGLKSLLYEDRNNGASPSAYVIDTDGGEVLTFVPGDSYSHTDTDDVTTTPAGSDEADDSIQEDDDWSPLVLTVTAPELFDGEITLVLSPVDEFLSPGFVIQRVRDNKSWLEEGPKAWDLDCYYTGRVLEAPRESKVALSVCDGVRGLVHVNSTTEYHIEPTKTESSTPPSSSSSSSSPTSSPKSPGAASVPTSFSSQSSSSSSSSNSSSSSSSSHSSSKFSSRFAFTERQHIISLYPASDLHSITNCSITVNFKHQRLKQELRDLVFSDSDSDNDIHGVYSTKYRKYGGKSGNRGAAARERGEKARDGEGAETESSGNPGSDRSRRRKRSPGETKRHTVETLVVADYKMYQHHGKDVQLYVLTLMSVVRSVFRSPTIRNHINIVVSKLVVFESLKDMPFKMVNNSSNAALVLKRFCEWQLSNNSFAPNSTEHHDTAILITRENICRAEGQCDTLGLADLGTICDKTSSCSVIEDTGISAAFTIAHELGHVFNLPHDDAKKCREEVGDAEDLNFHIMAPRLAAQTYSASPWYWSECSARLLTRFLESGHAKCLQDGARVQEWDDRIKALGHPGDIYSVNKQCELNYGRGYSVCLSEICSRLWCRTERSGCTTNLMPWADGTPCGNGTICYRGSCVPRPNLPQNPVNGGWGPWSDFGPCSRTCGGGVKKKTRECNNPTPQRNGDYCLGERVRYRSCSVKMCPAGEPDFRWAQCNSEENKMKYRYKGFSIKAEWRPMYSEVDSPDACKLYCRTRDSSYFLFARKVIDGTKCGQFTDDICVDGRCWAVGCDNKLNSTVQRDGCGVCGGNNNTCKMITGRFNNAIYGYNHVATIPSGATDVDIRQYGTNRIHLDDENYLALANAHNDYILNGDNVIHTEPTKINVKGAMMQYSGPGHMIERINTTMMIAESLKVYVLSVGKLRPPNVTFSYMVSVELKGIWIHLGWHRCSHICNGIKKSRVHCIHEDNHMVISKKHCRGTVKPNRLTVRCNTDCQISWQTVRDEDCPARCGFGYRRQLVHCMKKTGWHEAEIVNDLHCERRFGAKPNQYVSCKGLCLSASWSYTDWSPCSVTCGDGVQERQAACMDEQGKQLEDKECDGKNRTTSRKCNPGPCPQWSTGTWLGCSVSCGEGMKRRKVWCTREGQQLHDSLCATEKPPAVKECNLETCPEWYPGGWGPCSVTCGRGVSMRAVKCRAAETFQDDEKCNATHRPVDKKSCFMGICPTTPKPMRTTSLALTSKPVFRAYWRYGAWTECSKTCGSGLRQRYVVCMDYNRNRLDDTRCGHLAMPPREERCMRKPCGDWRLSEWGDCTVTCGEGIQIRYVVCTFGQQRQDDSFCDTRSKPETEIRCNRGTCLTPEDDFKIAVITSNRVTATSHWRVSSWSLCSKTCGTGWERRHVLCRDERGESDKCDRKLKPDQFRSCSSGPCPSWTAENWSNCSATECGKTGQQTRRVLCSLPNGQALPPSNCNDRAKPQEIHVCTASCTRAETEAAQRPKEPDWWTGPWSTCSVSCNNGIRSREVKCKDLATRTDVDFKYCRPDARPRNTGRCFRGRCPRWKGGRWGKCSVSCGKGERKREVRCVDKRNRVISPVYCPAKHSINTSMVCKRRECTLYNWKKGPWSECSRTCGFGKKHRSVTCVDRSNSRVSSHLCDSQKRPKIQRRCSEFPCPFIWNTGPWSECSSTCGEGRQERSVTCQAVTPEGWILDGAVPYGCRAGERPSETRYCNYGHCSAQNHWSVRPWQKCNAKCGHGRQRRLVICTNKEGKRIRRNNCYSLFRPVTKRSCYSGHCYARSCLEFKRLTKIRKDGEYKLRVGDKLRKIYCRRMRSKEPKEYISLAQPPEENYAEVFGKRLRRPNTCPNDGNRPRNDCPECRLRDYSQAKNATFTKVRIDISTLTIIPTDKTFSNQSGRRRKSIPFASAGDCYSANKCPQGRFSINLVDTGFAVSSNSSWTLNGHRASKRIWRLKDGQIIRGMCGGYCGACFPNSKNGLKLELVD